MLKMIGITAVLLSSVMFGFYLTRKLRRHIEILSSLREIMLTFKREISYRMTPMSDLFGMCSDLSVSEFTGCISDGLQKGRSLGESVKAAEENTNCMSELTGTERAFVLQTLSDLGGTDVESQISMLENAVQTVDEFINIAKENKAKNSKVYFTMSLYIGIAIAIIFI